MSTLLNVLSNSSSLEINKKLNDINMCYVTNSVISIDILLYQKENGSVFIEFKKQTVGVKCHHTDIK